MAGVLLLSIAGCSRSAPPPAPPAPPPPPPAPAPAPAAPAAGALEAAPPPLSGSGAAPADAAEVSAAPTAALSVTPPNVSGKISDANTVTRALEKPLTECYQQALAADASAGGKVLMALRLGNDGKVSAATASRTGNISEPLASCLETQAKAARFSAPNGGIVSFGMTLEPKTKPARASGTFADEERVATFVRANARECYRKALRIDARAEGDVQVTLSIDATGRVTAVSAARSGSLPDSVARCIEKKSQLAQFKQGPAELTVPAHLALRPAK
jgi:hypothetical protein